MSLGKTQTILICSAGNPWGIQGPCPQGQTLATQDAYVLFTSASSSLELNTEPFDPVVAGEFFALALTSTVLFYLAVHGISLVLKMVRD